MTSIEKGFFTNGQLWHWAPRVADVFSVADYVRMWGPRMGARRRRVLMLTTLHSRREASTSW